MRRARWAPYRRIVEHPLAFVLFALAISFTLPGASMPDSEEQLAYGIFVPAAQNDAFFVGAGGTLHIPSPGVLGNDTGASEAILASGPAHGALVLRNDGSFSYTHDGSATTTDSFTYTASDGISASSPATVSITIQSIDFGVSALEGHTLTLPSSIQFGPDGRLYALRKLGQINIAEITRDGPNDYRVVDEEIVTLIRTIPNHDDDGYPNAGEKNRQCTGLLVAGTASNPIVYVTSSDNRVGGGSDEPDTWLDTNSGVLSRLTWTGATRDDPGGYWEKVDLVRGLPRSEENHAPNGMQLSVTGDTLFVTSGGFTNAGAPSKNLAYINEYALSGAVLSVDLPALEAMPTGIDEKGVAFKYDLPTLDDPTRPNKNGITDPSAPGYDGIDIDDPWGGNDGLNQAKLVPGGPVQIHSPGYRNVYDLVITSTPGRAGRMYTIDNGANRGWGGFPPGDANYPGPGAGQCTNAYDPAEPGSMNPGPFDNPVNNENGLHYIRELKPGDENYAGPGETYYGGHPNPIRGNPAGAGLFTGEYHTDPGQNTGVWRDGTDAAYPLPVDWPPVPVSEANPAECDFRNSGETDGALVNFAYSTNGIAEYTASNFAGALKGNLLAAAWNQTELYRIILNDAGDQVLNPTSQGTDVLAQGFGSALLDVTAQGDDAPFPGTIWVTDFSGHEIYVLEPSDYGQSVSGVLATAAPQLRFGDVPTGGSIKQVVPLTNMAGSGTVSISDAAIEGTDAAEFTIVSAGGTTLQPGVSTQLGIQFQPTSAGPKSALLVIDHDGLNAPLIVDIEGAGTLEDQWRIPFFRVNAGGPMIVDASGPVWQEDQALAGGAGIGTPHAFVNASESGDQTEGTDDTVAPGVSVPPGTPTALFQRGRLSLPVEPRLEWDIPVDAGKQVEVRLFLAEHTFTAPNVPTSAGWPRVFDIEIDGEVMAGMDQVDLFESAGHDIGVVKSAIVQSDGNLDIDFVSVSGNPVVQGIEVAEVGGFYSNMKAGWNLVGLPGDPASADYLDVFTDVAPRVPPSVWTETAEYELEPEVRAGRGYWVLAQADRAQTYPGVPVTELSIDLHEGWNMIAGPACELALSAVSDPENVIVPGALYYYDVGYTQETSLAPGKGYWLNAASAGTIALNCASAGKQPAPAFAATELDDFGLIAFIDGRRGRQQLYWGGSLDDEIDIRTFAMPPGAPAGSFDVRFVNEQWLTERHDAFVRLQSTAYPIQMKLARTPRYTDGALLVEEIAQGRVVQTHELLAGQQLNIANPAVDALHILSAAEVKGEVPERFVVHGNYPNPFNPTTTLVFDLPEEGAVDVAIFDILGRQVLDVPAADLPAGTNHRITIDASSLASGVYLYRIQAAMASSVEIRSGQMILLQ